MYIKCDYAFAHMLNKFEQYSNSIQLSFKTGSTIYSYKKKTNTQKRFNFAFSLVPFFFLKFQNFEMSIAVVLSTKLRIS